jgi:hypothetical protein
MTSSNTRREDLFIDWLDAALAGRSTPTDAVSADSDLLATVQAAHRFHGLDERATRYALASVPHRTPWEDIMSSTSASVPSAPHVTAPSRPHPSRRAEIVRRWDRVASLFLVASIVLAIVLGLARVVPTGTDGPPNDGDTGFTGVIPMATVPPDTELSAYPLVTAADCTQTPMTRDEIIAHLTAANIATGDEFFSTRYEQWAVVPPDDEAAVMATVREWTACNLRGKGLVYSMRLQTPWMTGQFERAIRQSDRPATAWEIEQRADVLLGDPELDINATPIPAATPATPGSEPVFPEDSRSPVTVVPLPEEITPLPVPEGGGRSFPTVMAGEMQLVGPDRIQAPLYWVDEKTLEIELETPYTIHFMRVGGVWLIDFYGEAQRG